MGTLGRTLAVNELPGQSTNQIVEWRAAASKVAGNATHPCQRETSASRKFYKSVNQHNKGDCPLYTQSVLVS